MNVQPDLLQIPLQQLTLSPRNVRKTAGSGVEALAASIAAHGLLQNLTAQPSANDPTRFEVIAGGLRLAALQLLAQRGMLPESLATAGIPCRLIDDDNVALEASTAENTLREAMHPADQFEAFKGMLDAGKPLADVAAHFGVTERVVSQRLKLANIAPDLLEVYRQDGMTLEQLQALALTDDHEAQRLAWFGTKGARIEHEWQRSVHRIRDALTKREISANGTLARFVGLAAYEAAGGGVRRDLFSTQAWLQDKALADKLAMDQLETIAQRERDDGWSWAEARLTADYSAVSEFGRLNIEPAREKPTLAMKQRLADINARLKEIQAELYDEHGDQREGLDQDTADELEAEESQLQDEAREVGAGTERWPTDAMQAAGVLVYLDEQSGLKIVRGLLKPGQKVDKVTGAITGKPPAASGEKAKPKKPELSAAILQVLSAHRSEVARHHVARDPQLALALLVDWYISALKHDFSHADVLSLSWKSSKNARTVAPDIHKALGSTSDLAPAAAIKNAPKVGRLAWLVKQPQADMLQMLAYLVSTQFDGITDSADGHRGIAQLHAIVGFDMADHWTPMCDGFLTRTPAALVSQAVTEAKGKDAAAALQGLKKDALVAEAGKQLAGTGWLPPPLRGSTYALRGTLKPEAPKKPAAKASAKPGAKPKPSAKKAAKKVAPKKAKKAK